MSYLEAARGSTIADIKDNKDFQTDLVRFLSSSRKNYSINELKELGVDGMVDEYVEHMRSQDVNEATAAMDLYFAKDTNARDADRLAFGRLMSAWDSVEGAGTGKRKGVGDYLEGLVTSPATLATVFTGGYSKLAGVAATKSTQLATRAALKKIMSKEFAKQAAKGAVAPAIVEGGVGYAQIEMQEGAREATIGGYEGMTAGQKALAVGIQSGVGGTIGGISKALDMRKTDKVLEVLTKQSAQISANKASSAKKAVNTLAQASGTNKPKVDKLLRRMASLTESLAKREATTTKKPLDPTKVLEGDKLRDTILKEGADSNISAGLSRHTLQAITGAALQLTERLKIEPDQRISSALADALSLPAGSANAISAKEVDDIINDYGLSREEFGYIFLSDLSEAGRTLGAAGKISKELARQQKAAKTAIFTSIGRLADEGVSLYDDTIAKEIASEINFEKGYGERLVDFFKASDSLRIAFMTSQLGTTAANTMFSTARVGIDVVDEIFRQTLRTGYSAVTGQGVPLSNFHAVTSGLRAMSINNEEASLLRSMYARDFPEEYQRMFHDINRAESSVGVSTAAGKIGATVNFLNNVVDTRFKQMAFYSSVDRQLIEKGTSFKQWIANNNSLIDLPEEIRQKAVYDSLDFVFQKGYKSGGEGLTGKTSALAGGVIKLHKEAPFLVSGALGMPFPRYVANHIEFINDYTPIGLVTGGMKNFDKIYAGELKDPAERLARQLTGVSLLTGAYYARASQVEFDKEGNATGMKTSFSDMQAGEEGKTFKTGRVAGPLAAHQLLGDLMVRWKYDLPPPKPSEVALDALDVAGGLGNMGFDTGLKTDIEKAINEGAWGGFANRAANIAATFTYPVTVFSDMYGQIDPRRSYKPYTRDLMMGDGRQTTYNLLDAMLDDTESLNRIVRFLPEVDFVQYTQSINGKNSVPIYDPFSGEPVRSVDPIMKQITGIDRRSAPTELQKEIATLGLKEYRLYKRSTARNPAVDLQLRFSLSKTLPQDFVKWRSKPLTAYDSVVMYDDLEPEVKIQRLEDFISKQINLHQANVKMQFESLRKNKPRQAASYIRNQYVITEKQEEKSFFDIAVKSIPEAKDFENADEYISDSESIDEELRRREQILKLVDLQSTRF